MYKQYKFIGLKFFALILFIITAVLFVIDRIIPVYENYMFDVEYNDGNNVINMRYEKTDIDSLMSVAEAYKEVENNNYDVGHFNSDTYPLIDDMPSTESYNDETVNIVVFGDSFVYGEASLNRNELFWRQAEMILRNEGYNCRVSAVAMAGATAYEELNWLKEYLKENDPDIVVFGYVYNDALIDGSEYNSGENIDYRKLIPELNWVDTVFPNIYQKLIDYISIKTLYNEKFGDRYRGTNIAVVKDNLREYYEENFVQELERVSLENNFVSVVMTLPNTPGVMLKELYKPLHEIYQNSSVKFYDLIDDFNNRFLLGSKNNLYVNPENKHPGSAAHNFYAHYISKAIKSDFKEVLGEKNNSSVSSTIININDCTPYNIELKLIDRNKEYAEYSFVFPDSKKRSFLFFEMDPYCLTYPVNKNYIKLSFENPIDISKIELSGVDNYEVNLYYTNVNKKLGYDDNTVNYAFFTTTDKYKVFDKRLKKVTSLCVAVNSNVDKKINVKIYS